MHKIAERCRDALEHLRGVEEITISLQANGFGRSIGRPAGLASVRSAVAVWRPAREASGKSTICTQTAFALASKGARVGVVDADVHGPSIPDATEPRRRNHGAVAGRRSVGVARRAQRCEICVVLVLGDRIPMMNLR